MQSCGPKQGIISLVLVIAFTSTILDFPLGQDQYAYSQSSENNPAVKAAVMGVDLIDIHPSPSHLKADSKFEIFATIVNNSPSMIMFVAGACHSPLSAFFKSFNVVIKHTQGCNFTPIQIKVRRTGFSCWSKFRDNISSSESWTNTSNCYSLLQTENGQPANVTKPFVFTIS